MKFGNAIAFFVVPAILLGLLVIVNDLSPLQTYGLLISFLGSVVLGITLRRTRETPVEKEGQTPLNNAQ